MQRIEGWYLSYACLGVATAGMIPIALPLVVSHNGGAADIGLVMAAFNLGGLAAPLWGGLSDRYRLHRWLLVGGLLATAAGSGLIPFAVSLVGRLLLALLLGTGSAAALTVANLFIVEVHPKSEWDERIGWLQTFYGGGQVIGLLMAGAIVESSPQTGLWLAAGIVAFGVIPGLLGTRRRYPGPAIQRPVLLHPARHSEWPFASPQRLYHHLGLRAIRKLGSYLSPSLILFLIMWLFSYAGSIAFFSLYPVLMHKVYGVSAPVSSAGYALAAGMGLLIYAPAGRWSRGSGPMSILRDALVLRLGSFLFLSALVLVHFPGRGWLAVFLFLLVVLAWSLLSVSGTAVIADLSSSNEGEGMGIFNAVTALSGVIGSVVGGWFASLWGYSIVPVISLSGVAVGILVSLIIRSRSASIKNGPEVN